MSYKIVYTVCFSVEANIRAAAIGYILLPRVKITVPATRIIVEV
jgi:hypothetical protein